MSPRLTLALLVWCTSLAACVKGSEPGDAVPPARVPTQAPPPMPAVVSDDSTRAAALRGELPPGPEATLLSSRCAICHSTQYLTQQRLTEAQWTKTLQKMKKWGAPVEDAELAHLAKYLGTHFPVDLPPPSHRAVAPPAGALYATP